MTHSAPVFTPFAQRMAAEGLSDLVIKTFEYYYTQLVSGETGVIPEPSIEPVDSLPDVESFPARLAAIGREALPQTIIIKLNGGLGTSMGLAQAKSLLPVKNGLTFLDIIARQALKKEVPLVLMNSFATRADSLARLNQYPALTKHQLPLDFVQHKVPKIDKADLSPVSWPPDPTLEWCPPGHGDIYTALVTSGMLESLLEAGCKYAFVSNADNLGAVMDASILGYFVEQKLPFMMEAADRTAADKKGGHLARRADGQLILRESAQCLPDDETAFQDITRHKYFNTNNLWLNLPALQKVMTAQNNILGLPMIRNRKTVDPRAPDSPPVYQLETAMGSAIAVFGGAGAVRVPRRRFAPVKTTSDLLAVRSDAYILTDDYQVVQNPERALGQVVINLDPVYYKLVDDMDARFADGIPSLLECERLTIKGDIYFGRNVTVKGSVTLENPSSAPQKIKDNSLLENLD